MRIQTSDTVVTPVLHHLEAADRALDGFLTVNKARCDLGVVLASRPRAVGRDERCMWWVQAATVLAYHP